MMESEPPPLRDGMETLTLTDPLISPSPSSTVHLYPADGSDPLLNPPSPTHSPSSIDPPSYADVIFSPNAAAATTTTTNSNNHSWRNPHSPPSSSSTSDYLKITVSDPLKEQESTSASLVPGSNTFVTYLITSRLSDAGDIAVRRRFRDFVTLADRLAESYRGFFIPPRPDKSLVESQVMQKQEFVEQRRAALEKYLIRLSKHPVIGKSDELKVFLRVQGKLPMAASADVASRVLDGAVRLPSQLFGGEGSGVVQPQEAVVAAKGGRDLLRIFKELKQSVANDWGGGRPPAVEEDREFLERKERVQNLEQQLTSASQQAEALVKAQQDIGETMGELGLAFLKLGNFETQVAVYNSQRTRAADLKRLATGAVRASRSYRESNAQTVKHLDTLHEYLGLMLAVHTAFSDRSSALLTVQTLMSDLSSLHTRAEKLEAASSKIFGGDKSRTHRLEELKDTIRKTEDAKSCAIREYERIKINGCLASSLAAYLEVTRKQTDIKLLTAGITLENCASRDEKRPFFSIENNRNELERLDRERRVDFLGMLEGFVINQVGYAEKSASIWAQVAEETSRYARPK